MHAGRAKRPTRASVRSRLWPSGSRRRDKPVDQITADDVLGVLQPIWPTKPETASRLRGRIEKVLNAARVVGHIDADGVNATWIT